MLMLTAAGRLGKDGELRSTQQGDKVLSFSVAVNVRKDQTAWVNCAIWGDRAEKLAPYLVKGTAVSIIGHGSVRQYESNGKAGASLECRVSELTLLGGGKSDDTPTDREQKRGGGPARPAQDLDDEIPF
jgi:single-strand DNA-binding protein